MIYQLVMRNHDFDAFLKKIIFFGGKMGAAATVAPKGLGPQDPAKKLAHWVDLLGQSLSRKLVLKISGLNPLNALAHICKKDNFEYSFSKIENSN